MAFEHKANSGSIFRNDRKSRDSQPDHRGDCKIDGTDYWISAWVNETNGGTKYFSLKFEPKEGKSPATTSPTIEFDKDVPF